MNDSALILELQDLFGTLEAENKQVKEDYQAFIESSEEAADIQAHIYEELQAERDELRRKLEDVEWLLSGKCENSIFDWMTPTDDEPWRMRWDKLRAAREAHK